jgi:hypothetical protein
MKNEFSVILIYRVYHPINVYVFEGGKGYIIIKIKLKKARKYLFCIRLFLSSPNYIVYFVNCYWIISIDFSLTCRLKSKKWKMTKKGYCSWYLSGRSRWPCR